MGGGWKLSLKNPIADFYFWKLCSPTLFWEIASVRIISLLLNYFIHPLKMFTKMNVFFGTLRQHSLFTNYFSVKTKHLYPFSKGSFLYWHIFLMQSFVMNILAYILFHVIYATLFLKNNLIISSFSYWKQTARIK